MYSVYDGKQCKSGQKTKPVTRYAFGKTCSPLRMDHQLGAYLMYQLFYVLAI